MNEENRNDLQEILTQAPNEIKDAVYHRAVDCIPNDKHTKCCLKIAPLLEESPELAYYLCPPRIISFDGYVTYEGRRFGVPYWYTEKTCRVKRDGYVLYIYDYNMTKMLTLTPGI